MTFFISDLPRNWFLVTSAVTLSSPVLLLNVKFGPDAGKPAVGGTVAALDELELDDEDAVAALDELELDDEGAVAALDELELDDEGAEGSGKRSMCTFKFCIISQPTTLDVSRSCGIVTLVRLVQS